VKRNSIHQNQTKRYML